jgi:hypothetical protein
MKISRFDGSSQRRQRSQPAPRQRQHGHLPRREYSANPQNHSSTLGEDRQFIGCPSACHHDSDSCDENTVTNRVISTRQTTSTTTFSTLRSRPHHKQVNQVLKIQTVSSPSNHQPYKLSASSSASDGDSSISVSGKTRSRSRGKESVRKDGAESQPMENYFFQ